ncbi:MAG: hypothetical protein ACXV8Q_00430 [Methylobacter sp.]
MTTNELKKLIEAGEVNNIVIFNRYSTLIAPEYAVMEGNPLYVIYAFDHEKSDVVSQFGEQLMNSSREAGAKTYTSLDRAYAAIRKLGWTGMIHIDG